MVTFNEGWSKLYYTQHTLKQRGTITHSFFFFEKQTHTQGCPALISCTFCSLPITAPIFCFPNHFSLAFKLFFFTNLCIFLFSSVLTYCASNFISIFPMASMRTQRRVYVITITFFFFFSSISVAISAYTITCSV